MHRFRITVESLSTDEASRALQFEVNNHDDIVTIARRLPARLGLGEGETKALVIGSKLLGEIVLKHRAEEPFSRLRPALKTFMQELKKIPDKLQPQHRESC